MMRRLFAIVATIALIAAGPAKTDPIADVDPMIGTGANGHVFPGATLPGGMVQLSPSNDRDGWNWTSGYHYSDRVIDGFAHTHISGAGLGALGDILVMPARRPVTTPGDLDKPGTGYRSRFSHAREVAQPGYYRVHLDDPDVEAELTATLRTGFHRYTFNGQRDRFVIVDPGHSVGDYAYRTGIEIVSDREIRGFKKAISQSSGDRTVYFTARFSQPFTASGLTESGKPVTGRARQGTAVRAYFQFTGDRVEMAVAISHTGYPGAQANFAAEAAGNNFDRVRAATQEVWRHRLDLVRIDEPSAVKRRVFYTAAYHAALSPNLISDVTGTYYVAGKVRRSTIPQFSNFSNWDTYRALHPLLTIIDPKDAGAMVASMVSRHADARLILPSWEAVGHDNRVMIGYPIVSTIADAVLKGLPGVDPRSAFAAIRASAFDRDKHSNVYDANGMDGYLAYGFVPADVASSVAKTTEQNYQDWAIGRVAEKLGRTDDAALFARRATGWRQLYDAQSGDLLPRLADGRFAPLRRDDWGDLNRHYVSGNIWAYSAYTPHDMVAAIQLHGGRAAYARWLDGIFKDTTPIGGEQHVDLSGFIGRYGHGDEPGHHMAYLFNLTGQPWRTQFYVNRIVREMYTDRPDGLINNEDLGQMSAWYVFSTLGFYPVTPGDLTYQIGAPYYARARIAVGGGRTFTVEAERLSADNIYVQSATLNGQPLTRTFLTHGQITAGGVLHFVMGARPNPQWGAGVSDSSLGAFDDRVTVAIPKLAPWQPYDPEAEPRFSTSRTVTLKSEDPGATIRYTLDDSEPRPSSPRFAGPITIDRDTTIRAAAWNDPAEKGAARSTTFEQHYVRSLLSGLPTGYPRITLGQSDIGYGSKDGAMLIDGVTATQFYGDKKWTGRTGAIDATIDLGTARAARVMTLGYLDDAMNGVMPPRRIMVLGGNTPGEFAPIGQYESGKWSGIRKVAERETVELPGKPYRYYRISVAPWGDMPPSLSKPGRAAWLFLDEINLQ